MMIVYARSGCIGNNFRYENQWLFNIDWMPGVRLKMKSRRFETFAIMYHRFIFTTVGLHVLVTWGHRLLHRTGFCFCEECDILNMTATIMNAHDKAGRRQQHQAGEQE